MNEEVLKFVIILLVFSILLNMYQYIQIKRYEVNERSYKVSWQEVMNLKNPISLLLWWLLCSGLVIGIIFGFVVLFLDFP
ncbi:hypothetical protein BKP45_14235 [Anaerobacillus alkalidiazotrophicus]|uniref:Uncharacterized protein n=1 Tax=Anaerobacillus alkalidiazotrophicus TaxID=472963 RepID=A0A1S2M320_9BACI|nr:hypothetical protein [Anaerobacillus alkalidiazotrophicus]OIJ19162.1 hypothetical protein BKP45_14235 [Anaerobacillus alkalidiazotrophicus]